MREGLLEVGCHRFQRASCGLQLQGRPDYTVVHKVTLARRNEFLSRGLTATMTRLSGTTLEANDALIQLMKMLSTCENGNAFYNLTTDRELTVPFAFWLVHVARVRHILEKVNKRANDIITLGRNVNN
jgi:hypothetical protein